MSGKLAISLKRSIIGEPHTIVDIVRGLGLRKIRQTVILPDNPCTRGAVIKVRHMVDVKVAE
ncbi:MAG: 50S ribosomal protein L30 [bacterium]